MPPQGDTTLPAPRRIRKSIGVHSDARKAVDKENATIDLGAASKSSRSKSMGPGGLDALKQGSGNRRASLAAPTKLPRSILKPTAALPEIPPLRKRGASIGPEKFKSSSSKDESGGSKVALRTEEEQQATAREREERERRDARRKSLANRRVSFAAEATLHTFHEIDFNQDSTASTDSSRRASSKSSSNTTDAAANTQDVQRRNSGLPSTNFHNRDDNTATSMIYSSDSEPADAVEELASEEEEEDSNSDSDDGTMMSVVTEEVTGTSVGSMRSDGSAGQSSTLDEALRLAAQRAGVENVYEEEEEEDDEDEEVIPSFGWIKKGAQNLGGAAATASSSQHHDYQSAKSDDGTEAEMDMTGAVGGILSSSPVRSSPLKSSPLKSSPIKSSPVKTIHDEDLSMEVTRVFGGILGGNEPQNIAQESESEGTAPMEEATMELTTAIGGIARQDEDTVASEDDGNEDMSMELTAIMGGVLAQNKRQSVAPNRRHTLIRGGENDDATMDMTTSIGRVVADNHNEEEGEATMGMDMTASIGGIISNSAGPAAARDLGKRTMVEEGDKPNDQNKAIEAAVAQGSPKRRQSSKAAPQTASENDDPGLWAFQGHGLRRSVSPPSTVAQQATPDSRTPSPVKPVTPRSKSASPRKGDSNATARTTRSATRSASKSSSPVKGPPAPATASTPSPTKGKKRKSSIFNEDSESGTKTPSVVLTPQRRLSGVGADRSGLGSPRVAALFDRRGSLGDAATDFVPGKRLVSFQDPKGMAAEVDKERQLEEDKENGERDTTSNLRGMIDNLSPKRMPLNGRKSLHVGSAKGVLGKRPAELESEEDSDEEQDGVKRLKGHQGSPVKNVKLKNPPPKAETTGHLMRHRPDLDHTGNAANSTPSSPSKTTQNTTPRHKLRFMQIDDEPTTREVNFRDSPAKNTAQLELEVEEGRIHLQDFLNMTSIRFMELTTTKRRHTAAPSSFKDGTLANGEDDISLERCVVAGACTVPTLELYQHSCRELKKYISEGRRIVKEIEADTLEENPPLFREYISATAEVKALMDNQFKNVKTHARLLSKAMWYEWRMKLQDGLKEGLVGISEGMNTDQKLLQKQQDLLSSTLPDIVSRYDKLLEQSTNLEESARELADSDPAQLQDARGELTDLDADIAHKKKLIAELQQEFEEAEADVEELSAKKQDCLSDIKESEKTREECRGWTSAEIDAFKARVEAIEHEHGWAVTGIQGTTLSMTYKREIELVFDIASFQPGQPSCRIDLWYIAENKDAKTDEKEFFLQCIRDHVRALPQSKTPVPELLRVVGAGWDQSRLVTARIHRVHTSFPTRVIKTSDSSVALISSIMLGPLESRVEVTLNLLGRSESDGIVVDVKPEARVIYGERFNVGKVGEFLASRVGESVGSVDEEWSDIVVELKERLIARGRK